VLDNGYWSKGPDGKWVNKGRDEVPGAEESGRYIKYAVFLRESLKAPLQPLPGQVLQIVPLKAALPQHKDESMTVRQAGIRKLGFVTDPADRGGR